MNTTTATASSSAIGPPPPMSDPLPHTSQDTTTTTTSSNSNSHTVPSPPTAEVVNLRPPSKLPSRPRKLRKLSPETTDSSTTTTTTTTTTLTVSTEKILPRRRATIVSPPLPRSLSSEGEVEAAIKHLRTVDPILSNIIDLYTVPKFDSCQPPFLALAKSILYQQLAYKAGSSIYSRFVSLCGGESFVVPETILSLSSQQLRQIGVSGRKAEYLHELSRKYQNGILSDTAIANMDDKSLFTMLTMVNGIGSWSVHMFMIFSLHRPDVLPANDLGIRKGVQAAYGLKELPRPSQMEQLCEKWRPYRSVACWYIWRYMEAQNGSSTSVVSNVPASGVSLQQRQQEERQVQVQVQVSPHQQPQHQHQQQFVDPVNGIINLGQLS